MELIEEVDAEGKMLAVHPKEKLNEKMFLHKVSLVIPRGKDNSFIFSKRAKDKFPFPSTWMCGIGGKVAAGETPLQAAERETKEEAGVSLLLEQVASFVYDQDDYKGLFYVFTTTTKTDLRLFRAEAREVQFFQEFSLPQIASEINNKPALFAPTFREALKVFVKEMQQ